MLFQKWEVNRIMMSITCISDKVFFFLQNFSNLTNPIMLTEDNRMTQRSYLYPTCPTDSIIYIIQRKSNQNQSTKGEIRSHKSKDKDRQCNGKKAWVRVRLCKLQKNSCTRLAAASDKVYQLLVYGRWFYLASSTTKTGTISVVSEDKI
jgi:hypothetical protein